MTETHDASTSVPSGEDGRQAVPDPGLGGVRLSDRTLRHLRLVPSLLDYAAVIWRSNLEDIWYGRNWAGSIMVLTDQPAYDRWPWLDDQEVVDGDLEGALRKILARTCDVMTPTLPEDPRYNADRPEPMEYDVALTHRGRILAVVRESPHGPVVTRLDGAPVPSEQDHVDAPTSVAGTPGSVTFRRMSWVSTPQTRAVASRLIRQKGNQHAPWMWSVTALMAGPDTYRDRRLSDQKFDGGGLSEAVDAVITMASEAMLPVSPDRSCLDPAHPEPLAHDVAVACCGRIHAVVQKTPAGPIVTVFDDATHMVQNGPSAEEVRPT